MSADLVHVEHISYRYPDGTIALRDISFSLREGERVGLLGANGAGKSTLLLHLNGVLRSQDGQIVVDGLPLDDKHIGRIRALVGLVFQNPDDQLFSTTVYQDVAFGLRYMGLPKAEIETRVTAALAQVGMSGAADRIPFHLSGGEKKRIALATVLSMQPKLLVLDEPSSGLDPRARRELIALLKTLHGQTLLISTHDMRLAADLCNRVIILDGGQIVADGEAETILYDSEFMERHGLESP